MRALRKSCGPEAGPRRGSDSNAGETVGLGEPAVPGATCCIQFEGDAKPDLVLDRA